MTLGIHLCRCMVVSGGALVAPSAGCPIHPPAAREQDTPSSDVEALIVRVAELIGAGIEMHYRAHRCEAPLDGVCATCRVVGAKVAPVVVFAARAALAAREAEVRREVEAWLKSSRDMMTGASPGDRWDLLDMLLDDYRLHMQTGTPLDQHVCDGGCDPACGGA